MLYRVFRRRGRPVVADPVAVTEMPEDPFVVRLARIIRRPNSPGRPAFPPPSSLRPSAPSSRGPFRRRCSRARTGPRGMAKVSSGPTLRRRNQVGSPWSALQRPDPAFPSTRRIAPTRAGAGKRSRFRCRTRHQAERLRQLSVQTLLALPRWRRPAGAFRRCQARPLLAGARGARSCAVRRRGSGPRCLQHSPARSRERPPPARNQR